MFDRDEKSDPDWSRVEFPYVLLLSCQFEGYHPFHGAGTF